MKIFFETTVEKPFETVRDNFNEELFAYLKPPGVTVDIERFDGCKKGDEVHLLLHTLGKKQKWISLITDSGGDKDSWYFIDEGKETPWPVTNWKHIHTVTKLSDDTCKITDDISYDCSPKWIAPFAAPALWLSFAIRPFKYQKFFREKA